ncbi:MAG: asparagine synthase (glutamine-hydrolyzing) [Chitinophagaceae bacterium]|nr:asparagine synthase (glutamine-hydrolyzing) [Chitinophagaceae bacterium]
MCGIAGIIGEGHKDVLHQMLHAQRHRGPDNTSIWIGENIALGHNRLSIIDLSEAANQPMQSGSGRYHIVFNGEIYNYKELQQQYLSDTTLRTHSDTEVLLALYEKKGIDMLPLLIGMFAFAIWDSVTETLLAVRDRFGVKPFYYSKRDGQYFFASEIKSLWAAGVPKQTNDEVWAGFFTHGMYGQPHQTFWEHIHTLPAGYYAVFEKGSEPKLHQWYQLEDEVQHISHAQDETEILSNYSALMNDAVALRFRADVPVGFNISGGLDSSTLLNAIHHAYPENDSINAYTFYCNDDRYDELPWVKQLIEHTRKPLRPVLLQAENIPALALEMAIQQDEPYGGIPTIAYSQIFKHARQAGVLVLLDGQGMDEAWGGYDYYYKTGGGIIQGSNYAPVLPATLDADFAGLATAPQYKKPFDNDLQNLQYRDIFYTKFPRALRFNDRASMLYSTELREPFLDHRLLEYAFALPKHMKYRDGNTKFGLRQLALRSMQQQLVLAPKRPLQTPQREWLRGSLKSWAEDYIRTLTGSLNNGWFNTKEVEKGWQDFLDEKTDNSFFVWQWINAAMLLQA